MTTTLQTYPKTDSVELKITGKLKEFQSPFIVNWSKITQIESSCLDSLEKLFTDLKVSNYKYVQKILDELK